MQEVAVSAERRQISLADAFWVWFKIGILSFGGPAGQIALMQRILVDEKGWVSEQRFLHALNYCMLLPGPEATQLAIYIGWLLHRTLGGLMAGILFLLPGVLAMFALSISYAALGNVPLVEALFFGLKAAVLAIVIGAVIRLGQRALANAPRYILAALAFLALFVFDIPFPLVILCAGLFGLLAGRLGWQSFVPAGSGHAAVDESHLHSVTPSRWYALKILAVWLPVWLAPLALMLYWLGPDDVFTQIGLFFSKLALVTFGGAYAVLSYMAQQAVEFHGWLAPGEMLDGLGLAETTPGPLIMVVQFVGFLGGLRESGLDPLLGGLIGGLIASWMTFVPSFLWIFLGAPYIESLRNRPVLNSALAAITAAVVGVILNLALWFGFHVVFDDVERLSVGPVDMALPVFASLDVFALGLVLMALCCQFVLRLGLFSILGISALAGVLLSWISGV
ncbi:chromate transporter [Alkalilimnicola ehrlichii]|uniref:Chromate transporter n=2 Tax=Alkalilimnicola ehrlichii TaxID=351052 RepID=A0A3E0WKI9_9GAMM|nr:chromate transporter [Alkalilimnicola ehrlichii]RFA33472.1 chromate transporter [Alkalilimnicola ehrlichii]